MCFVGKTKLHSSQWLEWIVQVFTSVLLLWHPSAWCSEVSGEGGGGGGAEDSSVVRVPDS